MSDPNENAKQGHRRRWRNFLLQPVLQIQLSVYTIALTVLFSSVLMGVIFLTFERVYEIVIELTPLGDEVVAVLNDYMRDSSGWLAMVVALYMLVNVLVTVVFTHKMVGPTVAFRRHIGNLIRGDYSSRLNLRTGDAFSEVAEDLNHLAERLGSKKSDEGL